MGDADDSDGHWTGRYLEEFLGFFRMIWCKTVIGHLPTFQWNGLFSGIPSPLRSVQI